MSISSCGSPYLSYNPRGWIIFLFLYHGSLLTRTCFLSIEVSKAEVSTVFQRRVVYWLEEIHSPGVVDRTPGLCGTQNHSATGSFLLPLFSKMPWVKPSHCLVYCGGDGTAWRRHGFELRCNRLHVMRSDHSCTDGFQISTVIRFLRV